MDLSNYIEELLYSNDCVIIPNIGGFILNYVPSKVDLIDQQVSAPCKQVSFNPKLVNNDGLLANCLVLRDHIAYNQAVLRVEEWSMQLERDLFNKKIIHFDNIGKLYFNNNSKLEFAPAATNFLLETYGLPLISGCYPILRNKQFIKKAALPKAPVALHQSEIAEKHKKKVTAISTIVESNRNSNLLTLPRIVAVAAILLVLVSSPFIFKQFSSNGSSSSVAQSAAPTEIDNTKKDKTTATASILPSPSALSLDITTTDSTTQQATTANIEEEKEERIQEANLETYVVVLGAFGKKRNASRLSKKLEKDNYKPVIEKSKSGLHRVGVEMTCTADEFKKHFQYIKDNYNKKAWLVE